MSDLYDVVLQICYMRGLFLCVLITYQYIATSLVSITRQQMGVTPLYLASENGNSKTVDLLLQYKATPDKATEVTSKVLSQRTTTTSV